MSNGFWDTLAGFLFGAGGATVLNWLLRRRESDADVLSKQQEVIGSLWTRIDALQERIDQLERELRRIEEEAQQLRRLLCAYEKRFGRRFRIAADGRIVELGDERTSDG